MQRTWKMFVNVEKVGNHIQYLKGKCWISNCIKNFETKTLKVKLNFKLCHDLEHSNASQWPSFRRWLEKGYTIVVMEKNKKIFFSFTFLACNSLSLSSFDRLQWFQHFVAFKMCWQFWHFSDWCKRLCCPLLCCDHQHDLQLRLLHWLHQNLWQIKIKQWEEAKILEGIYNVVRHYSKTKRSSCKNQLRIIDTKTV